MTKPTYDDAEVMLRLMQMYPVDAANYIWSDEFIPDHDEFVAKQAGRPEAGGSIRAVLGWFESVGTLYKHGLMNEELLFDWLAIDAVWDRVKGHALALREETGNAHFYENFEAMADAQVAWSARRDRTAA